jgi:Pyruvate/2-oxoacid:ferredoxin oxidoreductase delta subunit
LSTISFNTIKELFPAEHWDIGVLDEEKFLNCVNKPIKYKAHNYGVDYTNQLHFDPNNRPITNAIVLARQGHTWDYTFYDEAVEIAKQLPTEKWRPLYLNFKEAAILAGIGVRAKNTLIYSYKFGFDCHISIIGFLDKIVDVPTNKRVNNKLWSRCNGCEDCIVNCPANAIKTSFNEHWLDGSACDNFITLNDHSSIPSVKKFWHINVHPELPAEFVGSLKTMADVYNEFDGPLPFDQNGYTFDGFVVRHNTDTVQVPVCRECTSQPRCSKWNGNFPYK